MELGKYEYAYFQTPTIMFIKVYTYNIPIGIRTLVNLEKLITTNWIVIKYGIAAVPNESSVGTRIEYSACFLYFNCKT